MKNPTDSTRGATFVVAAGLLALLATPPMFGAETTIVPTTVGESAGELQVESDNGETKLGLEEAIVNALRHNLALVVQRYQRERSLLGIEEAMGIYDFNLGGTLATSSNTRPTSSTLESTALLTTESLTWNFNLSRLLALGGTASVNFSNSRTESTNLFVQPNPQFSSGLVFAYNQPLLRNFGRQITEQGILLARTNSEIDRQAFQTQVETLIQQVANGYWNLVEAREQLTVSEESLELAKNLHEMNRIQVEVGTMAPLEMVQSEAGVATRDEEIIRRRAAVEDAADVLRRLVNLQRGALWESSLVPVTDPVIDPIEVDLAKAYESALEARPDIRRLRLDLENRRLDSEVAANQLKPTVDLDASFGYNALGGSNSDPDVLDQSYGDTLQQLSDREFEGWRIAVTLGYPIGNRQAKARRTSAELFHEQGEVELQDLEQQVLLDVRQATRAVDTAAQQIESARVSSKLARKNLEAEQKRYENGLSTSFRVLEIQEDLSRARSSEVSAIIAYRNALTSFYNATGGLLGNYGIELAPEN